jgi:hypothetical protein
MFHRLTSAGRRNCGLRGPSPLETSLAKRTTRTGLETPESIRRLEFGPRGEIHNKMTAGVDAVRGNPWLARAKRSGEPSQLKLSSEVRTGHLSKLVQYLSVRNCRTAAQAPVEDGFRTTRSDQPKLTWPNEPIGERTNELMVTVPPHDLPPVFDTEQY